LIVDVIIPAYNEEKSIPLVLQAIPKGLVRNIIVVNNNSTDNTALVSEPFATVILEERKGYGSACLKGIEYLQALDAQPDVVVFLDADFSDHPEQMATVLEPIFSHKMDIVIGSRALGKRQKGAMLPQQVFGNRLAVFLIKVLYNFTYTDLGPFRAIRWQSLSDIAMVDTNFGWTVEMQIKALKRGLRVTEVPVDYRKRIGVSKITGTLKGTIGAGYKIISTIIKYR